MKMIGEWIISLTAASILISATIAITPKGAVKRSVRLVGGLILLLILIKPLKELDVGDIAYYNMQYRAEYEKYEEKLITQNSSMIKTIIEDKTRTYILQKAEELGIECDAEVKTRTREDGYPYPDRIIFHISHSQDPAMRERLSYIVASELGVAEENQEWRLEEHEG
ncbi:MAG: stage III sporulation protein AF [Eubacteriales bacterium]|jgi:hypothetical protein